MGKGTRNTKDPLALTVVAGNKQKKGRNDCQWAWGQGSNQPKWLMYELDLGVGHGREMGLLNNWLTGKLITMQAQSLKTYSCIDNVLLRLLWRIFFLSWSLVTSSENVMRGGSVFLS